MEGSGLQAGPRGGPPVEVSRGRLDDIEDVFEGGNGLQVVEGDDARGGDGEVGLGFGEDGYDAFGVRGVREENERQAVKMAGKGDDEVFNVVWKMERDALGGRGLGEV